MNLLLYIVKRINCHYFQFSSVAHNFENYCDCSILNYLINFIKLHISDPFSTVHCKKIPVNTILDTLSFIVKSVPCKSTFIQSLDQINLSLSIVQCNFNTADLINLLQNISASYLIGPMLYPS